MSFEVQGTSSTHKQPPRIYASLAAALPVAAKTKHPLQVRKDISSHSRVLAYWGLLRSGKGGWVCPLGLYGCGGQWAADWDQ